MLSNSFQWPLLLFFSITVTRIVPEFHEIPFFQQGYLSSGPCSKTLMRECYNFEYQLARKKLIDEFSFKKTRLNVSQLFLRDSLIINLNFFREQIKNFRNQR